ncbi:MAG: ROK family transcriptional regulator [Canibacter sp.]
MTDRVSHYRAVQPREARSANASAVLRLILAQEPMSRSNIAKHTGLSQGTVTRIVADLVERGFLDEVATKMSSSGLGRPHVILAPSDRAGLILAGHIGVDYLHLGLIRLDGEIIESMSDLRHDNTIAGAIDAIERGLESLQPKTPLLGASVVTNGWVDSAEGVVRGHPVFPSWEGTPLRDLLTEKFGIPFTVDSSIRASAIADLLFGLSADYRNFIHVFLGNVTGVSMVMNRRVVEPANGGGGLLDNWIISDREGRVSSVQRLLTQNEMVKRAREEGCIPSDGELDDLIDSDSPGAKAILEDRAAGLASLLQNLNELVAPEIIFVTSSAQLVQLDQLSDRGLMPAPGIPVQTGPPIHYVDSPTHTIRAAAASFIDHYLKNPISAAS